METDSAATRQVLMLGGSTMWGYSARDEYTIPSLVAQRLARHGVTDVKVINLASIGYNTTQGAITLLLELRRGNTPAAVVSLDGVNEVGIIYEGESPGEVYAAAAGRAAVRSLELLAGGRAAPPASARDRTGGGNAAPVAGPGEATDDGARSALRPDRALLCPGGPLGGRPRPRAWLPDLLPVHTDPGPEPQAPHVWETWLAGTSRDFQELTVRCGDAVDSLLAPRRGKVYFPMDSLYDGDTTSVFIDHYGHVTERANGVIADRIVALLLPALRPAGQK